MAESPRGRAALRELANFGLQVGHMDGPPVQHRAAIGRPADEREKGLTVGAKIERPGMGHGEKPVAVAAEDAGVLRRAEARRALRHSIEHRLYVGWRPGDHTKD